MSDNSQVASPRHAEEMQKINSAMDPKISGLIESWRTRRGKLSTPGPYPIAELNYPSAIDVRLGWYIARRHLNDTLESFVPVTESQHDALQATRDWIASVIDGRGGALALVGGVGTGKSHLLYAAVRELNSAGLHCAAFGWYDLAEVRRDGKQGDEEARRKWGRLLGSSAFGLDEIRPTSGSDFDTTELSQLMTRAYRECQGVIVTSNHAGEKLSSIVGLAATSRLTQVVIIGPDMRLPAMREKYLA